MTGTKLTITMIIRNQEETQLSFFRVESMQYHSNRDFNKYYQLSLKLQNIRYLHKYVFAQLLKYTVFTRFRLINHHSKKTI